MNKLAQELNPIGIVMGVVGALLGYIMAGRMEVGILMKLITAVVTGIICYIVSTAIANQ